MNENMQKFRELLLTDENFQKKLKEAYESYTGEQTTEAIFNNVILPLGEEYGIASTFEDFQQYVEQFSAEQEMSTDELKQVAGGGKGAGAAACWIVGIGLGISADDDGHMQDYCIGIGAGGSSACMGHGADVGLGIEDKL